MVFPVLVPVLVGQSQIQKPVRFQRALLDQHRQIMFLIPALIKTEKLNHCDGWCVGHLCYSQESEGFNLT